MSEGSKEKRARRRMGMGLVATCRLIDFESGATIAKKLDQVNARLIDMSERGAQLELTGPFEMEEKLEKIRRFGPTQITLGVQINIPETNKHIEVLSWLMWFCQTKNGHYRLGVRFSEARNIEIFEHYLGGKAIVLHWK